MEKASGHITLDVTKSVLNQAMFQTRTIVAEQMKKNKLDVSFDSIKTDSEIDSDADNRREKDSNSEDDKSSKSSGSDDSK